MWDPYDRIQEHLGVALRKLSLLEGRVTAGQDPSRDAARCLADLQRVAQELAEAFDAVKRERQRLTTTAEDAQATMSRANKLFVESPNPCLVVVRRGGAVIEEANAAAARLLNVSQRHLIGKPFTHFLQQDRETFMQQLQRGADDAPSQWHVTLRPRERAVVRVLVRAIVDTDVTAAIALLPPANGTSTDDRPFNYVEPGGQSPAPSDMSSGDMS